MKKSVILLITILFISTISIFILKNLEDTDKFMKEVSSQTIKTQVLITIDNLKKEVPAFLKKNLSNIEKSEELVELLNSGIPLTYGTVDLFISINYYTKEYIKIITNENYQEDLSNMEIEYPTKLFEMLYMNIPDNNYSSFKQIDDRIEDYIEETKDQNGKNLLNLYSFFQYDEEKTFHCDFNIMIDDSISSGFFIFDLNKTNGKEVKWFEFYNK